MYIDVHIYKDTKDKSLIKFDIFMLDAMRRFS
jgi:hypothetical protein